MKFDCTLIAQVRVLHLVVFVGCGAVAVAVVLVIDVHAAVFALCARDDVVCFHAV